MRSFIGVRTNVKWGSCMKITEPVTMITDYALAALAIVLGMRLWGPEWQSTPVTLWAVGFYVSASAALTGGTFHGFASLLGEGTRTLLWNITVFQIGLGSGFMIAGAAVSPIGWSDGATAWLLAGLGFAVLGLAIQQSGWKLHQHLNHNDISHLVQMGALTFFYVGASMIG